MPEIPAAATAVLLRDGDAGAIEVLMLQRPDRGSFAGGWVFPGGKVEDADRTPSTGDDAADAERAAVAAAVRETEEETGLGLDPEGLVLLSHWTPPAELDTKFITWFFVARAPEGDIRLQEAEAVDHAWLRPADALKQHGAGHMRLFPPTWVTLDSLLAHTTVADALEAIAARETREYATKQLSDRGLAIWQGDEAYEGGDDTEEGPRHRLHIGQLPWRFERR